ncbi:ABC transporter permease [Paenibacillus aceris]|uniref:ABC-2 type transport system permease protein n=1 Tax=Paenibacillus aceris TaxID=869555 RepID=A0ABS4I8G3_9BACL|nr:ABC transporter permease [Paenibacillus aceris]MBP1967203.1 ABC-2 type transport system permease protein [Paenibacillus aceris]NHW36241.1 ABC transporter permease [Paenibacillus aceris]
MKAMVMNTRTLWQQRFEHYMKESMGYLQYAARSNFFGFLLFLVILSSYYYAKILQRLPTDYPYLWIVLLLLVPLISSSPIRTLARSADRMFLLRIEHQMGPYFRGGMMYSLTLQAFWTFLAWVVLWPLYHHCLGHAEQHFLWMLAFLLLMKVANLLASWQESRFTNERARMASVSFRWIATTALVSLQFLTSVLWASSAALILTLAWLTATHYVSKYLIGWDYLIAKEKQQQARLYAFFNWFVDVPQLGTRITRRSWISGVTKFIPFKQDAAYLYIYMKTLLRTELFTIVLRISLLGALAIAVSSSGTARLLIFFIALIISMVQLVPLERAHRYTFWVEMYPLDRQLKAGSLAFIIWSVLLLELCILSIPLLIRSSPIYFTVPLIGLAFISLSCGIMLRRKFAKNALLET